MKAIRFRGKTAILLLKNTLRIWGEIRYFVLSQCGPFAGPSANEAIWDCNLLQEVKSPSDQSL